MREPTLLKQVGEELRQAAIALEHEPGNLDVILRARVERGLFVSAKALALAYAGCDLHSFAGDSWSYLENRLHGAPVSVRDLLTRAFELKAALSKLSSSDAYVSEELVSEFADGRTEVALEFSRRLKKYAQLLVEVREK